MKLYPFHTALMGALEKTRYGTEGTFFQQFNCCACGTKQTMETPNRFHLKGICQECKTETNIEKDGCNYMIVLEVSHD
jgi:hypothetical protein